MMHSPEFRNSTPRSAGELRYAVEQTAAGNIDIRIAAADGTLLGAKRFAAVTTAAAPARTFPAGRRSAEARPC